MLLFWDTSAVIPLVIKEPHSAAAERARTVCTRALAWTWLKVEAEAALLRRGAGNDAWERLRLLLAAFEWLDMDTGALVGLCRFNRSHALRAADAGHLYVFAEALEVMPQLHLVTFDGEMRKAAARVRLPLWPQRAKR